jgi:hypothetical protein
MRLFVLIEDTGTENFYPLANSAVGANSKWLICFTEQQVRVFMDGTVISAKQGVQMKRPVDGVRGETPRIKTGCGFLYVTDNTTSEYKEVVFKLGKTGGCAAALLQALAVVTSLALRAGVSKEKIMDKWKGIGCPSPIWDGGVQILSCPDAIAQVLQKNTNKEIE